MQAVEQKRNQEINFEEINFEMIETTNCFQIRKNLDAVFSGESPLEEASAGIKRILFTHLEVCRDCCRSFDVRVRFRVAKRDMIY